MKRLVGCLQHHGEPNPNGSYEDHVMASKALPSPQVLRQLLRYEPDTGKLFWKERGPEWFAAGGRTSSNHASATWNTRYAGREALTARKTSGHLHGLLFRRATMAHRVAWAVYYGAYPAGHIDHINHDPADNRIANLRVVDDAANAKNRSPNKRKKSGLPAGVCIKRQAAGVRYFAQIQVNGKNNHLGYFDTPEEAHAAYLEAAKDHGFHENHAILRAYAAQQEPTP